MHPRKKTFFEEFTVAFSKQLIWEKCRELSRILPTASTNELHAIFVQICGDIFGYGAGGIGFGWDLASMTRSSSGSMYTGHYGHNQSYRDFSTALSFLGSNGPLFEVIHRLMHDPSHRYEFPISQLPVNYQKSIQSGGSGGMVMNSLTNANGTVSLTAFEYFLYHFASLLVRRQQQNLAPTNVNVNASSETLFVLLLEDYLTCFLPINPAMQAKLFTQPFQPSAAVSPQPQKPIQQTSPTTRQNRPTMFKKNFSPNFKHEEPRQDLNRQSEQSKSTSACSETWRSDTLVKVLVMFWIEGYAGEEALSENHNHSPTGPNMHPNSPGSYGLDYVSASIKVASSLPSAELMRAIRMFIKHSHYFNNACQQGSMYLPATMKVDIFSSKMNKMLLFSYLAKAIDHWPYDASFRLVLETWLSFIQPWRYLNMNNPEEEIKMDPARFSSFVSDNCIFYTRLMAKVLRRFQRLEIGSPKNAFMLFRVFKVMSQDNLFPCVKASAMNQGQLFQPNSAHKENIFSLEFKSFASELLLTSLKFLDREKGFKTQQDSTSKTKAEQKKQDSGFSAFLNAAVNFINGGSSADPADAEKAEREKVVQHLTLVTEKMSSMFELDQIVKEFKSFPPSNEHQRRESFLGHQESIDQADFMSSPNYGLSPEQRRGILNRKFKASGKYQGHPDLVPIRSDEFPVVVRLLHIISLWINTKFGPFVEETYYRQDLIGGLFREFAQGPATFLGRIDQVDSNLSLNTSIHGIPKKPVKLPPRIILRPLGGHMAVAYLAIFMFFTMIILGKSLIGSMISLMTIFLVGALVKTFLNPVVTPDSNSSAVYLSESFS